MPRLIPFRPAAACALALLLILSTAAAAAAKGPVASLRVVGKKGRVLAEDTLGAHKTSIKASPRADCFGSGTGGSGKTVSLPGPTALGLLVQESKLAPAMRPVLITDSFDFGLGICGIGSSVATSKLSWYLKVNHENPELGGESVKVRAGDEVLWDLAPFPYPDELSLTAPDRATTGRPFTVRVFAYGDSGKRSPAAGVRVTGADGPTGADGRASVTLSRPAELIATDSKDIPSNREAVCVGGKCP